jgi:dihydropteroate synthase
MILARVVSSDRPEDLEIAFARMALPTPAREYLLAKVPRLSLLLTGLDRVHGRFLRDCTDNSDAPGREEYPAFVSGDQRHRPGTALLSGRADQLERLTKESLGSESAELRDLGRALERALASLEAPAPLELGPKTFRFGVAGARPLLMGIVNVTPDSFSDGGQFAGLESAVAHGLSLARAGADLLDVGGESTRPGADFVPVEEEIRRVVPVIRGLREKTETPISVDTRKSEVARAALEAGATLVNDISGLGHDERMSAVVAEAGAALCAMHIRGTPESMQGQTDYGDVVEEVLEFLDGAVEKARAAGVTRERILVDPGIGFAKTFSQNQFLLRRLPDFRLLGQPVLVGFSRKGFLGALSGGKPAPERVLATAACAAAVAMGGGADILRVHDVVEVAESLRVAEAIRFAKDGGEYFNKIPLPRRGAGKGEG